MKLTVKKDELKGKLQQIQSCIAKSGQTPILSHFLIQAAKDGITITGTDLTVVLKEPLAAIVSEEGSLAIPAAKCLEIVKEAEENIVLESEKGEDWLKILFGRSKYRLACLPAKEFPTFPTFEVESEMIFKNSELLDMVEKTVFCAGTDDKRYTLNGLLFHLIPGEKELAVVATDGHRLALKTKALEVPAGEEKQIIVPRKAAVELKRILPAEGEVSVAIGKNHVLFSIGEVKFLARLIEGTYPSWKQVIPAVNGKNLIVERTALIKGIRKAAIVTKEIGGAIILETGPSNLILSSMASEIGEAKDELTVEYVGEPIKLGVKPNYLLEAVEALSAEKITLSFGEQTSPILIRNVGDLSDHTCVVMPVKL